MTQTVTNVMLAYFILQVNHMVEDERKRRGVTNKNEIFDLCFRFGSIKWHEVGGSCFLVPYVALFWERKTFLIVSIDLNILNFLFLYSAQRKARAPKDSKMTICLV